ncbi:hypothetical protein E4U26_005348 [Claviceps purpurea]|nr:hypothetical protein E4U26_005348 [Claviceps purpurea]
MGGPGTTTAVPDEHIQCVPIGGNTLDGDQWLADCRQAGTVDGYYRYKKDDTLDLSTLGLEGFEVRSRAAISSAAVLAEDLMLIREAPCTQL